MNMRDFLHNLIDEGQVNIQKNFDLDHPWIIMNHPLGTTDVDTNVFEIFRVAFKWHQHDVTQLLCSLQDIQTWALHRHFAEQSGDASEIAEQPILSAGQPRSMTTRKFRQLLKKHAEVELSWMEVFNHATEMQWWSLLMLRSIVGAITANDRLSKEDVDRAEQLTPNEQELDSLIAEANETGRSLDEVVAERLVEREEQGQ
jgi:hypothetical protein